MYIKSLELKNYRNYEYAELSLHEGTNIFYGDNAQGKTNILESMYLCGTTKSHRGSRDRDLIRFGESEAHIRMTICRQDASHRIDVHIRPSRTKGIAIDGIPIRRASELFGMVNFIFFSPEDLCIIKNGPSERRRFLDMELCQLDKVYLQDLSGYNKVLNQRNRLLKDMPYRHSLSDTLDVWDMQLASYGKKVIRTRKKFLIELQNIMKNIHSQLTGGQENLILQYEPNTEEDSIEEDIYKSREKDIRFRTSCVGPHRDDFFVETNGVDIRRFGSQGQQRTAALSLKLSEIALVQRQINESPVLLLDDVLSELDSRRQNDLLHSIRNIQTMVTCTGLDEYVKNQFEVNKIFRVMEGTVSCENGLI